MRYSGGGAALCLELCDVLHMQRSIDTHSMYDVGRLCQLPTIWGSVRVSLNCRSSYIPYIYHLTNSKVKTQVEYGEENLDTIKLIEILQFDISFHNRMIKGEIISKQNCRNERNALRIFWEKLRLNNFVSRSTDL